MHRRVAVPISLLVTASGLLVAPAQAAGTYAVSLTASRTSADVGQLSLLQGKVVGSGAARKVVAVDVRVDAGAWKRLGTTRTTSTGVYAYKVTATTAGTLSYRVIAPKGSSIGSGVSKAVSMKSYRWLDLYDQPYLTGGGIVGRGAHPSTTIGGVRPPAHSFAMGTGSFLTWNLAKSCDRVVAQAGLSDGDAGVTRTVRFEGSQTTDSSVTGGSKLAGYADLATSSVGYFFVSRPDDRYAYLVTPRAHCTVNALPVAID